MRRGEMSSGAPGLIARPGRARPPPARRARGRAAGRRVVRGVAADRLVAHLRRVRRVGSAARAGALARDVEEHLLEILPAIAFDQRLGRPAVDDAAAPHHQHLAAQPLDLGHVVRGQQDGGAARSRVLLEIAADPVGGIGIEAGGRLVEQQHLGLVEQRLGQRHPGLLPGRQAAEAALQEFAEIEMLGQLGDPPAPARHAVEMGIDREVLRDRQPLRQVDIGRGEVHPRQHPVAVAHDVLAQHCDAAGTRQQQAEQHRDGGGLAGAVAAEQRDGGPGRHGETDAVHRGDSVEALDQVVNRDDGRRAGGRGRAGTGRVGLGHGGRTMPGFGRSGQSAPSQGAP